MAGSATASSFNEKLFQAGATATANPYVRRLIEDADLRQNALTALKAARNAYERASAKNWSKSLTDDKKLKRELKSAVESLRDTRSSLVKQPKRKRRLRKLFLLAIIGGACAIATNESIRKAVLDKLFGAEEEFNYESTTTNGAGAGAGTA